MKNSLKSYVIRHMSNVIHHSRQYHIVTIIRIISHFVCCSANSREKPEQKSIDRERGSESRQIDIQIRTCFVPEDHAESNNSLDIDAGLFETESIRNKIYLETINL